MCPWAASSAALVHMPLKGAPKSLASEALSSVLEDTPSLPHTLFPHSPSSQRHAGPLTSNCPHLILPGDLYSRDSHSSKFCSWNPSLTH